MATAYQKERRKQIEEQRERDKLTGAAMKAKREKAGKKAYWVADRLGFSGAYISDLELGKRHWTPLLIEWYEKAIGA